MRSDSGILESSNRSVASMPEPIAEFRVLSQDNGDTGHAFWLAGLNDGMVGIVQLQRYATNVAGPITTAWKSRETDRFLNAVPAKSQSNLVRLSNCCSPLRTIPTLRTTSPRRAETGSEDQSAYCRRYPEMSSNLISNLNLFNFAQACRRQLSVALLE